MTKASKQAFYILGAGAALGTAAQFISASMIEDGRRVSGLAVLGASVVGHFFVVRAIIK